MEMKNRPFSMKIKACGFLFEDLDGGKEIDIRAVKVPKGYKLNKKPRF